MIRRSKLVVRYVKTYIQPFFIKFPLKLPFSNPPNTHHRISLHRRMRCSLFGTKTFTILKFRRYRVTLVYDILPRISMPRWNYIDTPLF